MEMKAWIRRQAAKGKPLNVHAVLRARPDLLAEAYGGPRPRGWRRCLIDAGVDPYRIVHEHENEVRCRICGEWRRVLEKHLQSAHGMTSQDYLDEHGPDCEVSSESFRVTRFSNKRVMGIRQWEQLWSRYQIIDWLIVLHEKGHDLNYFHVAENAKLFASAALRFFGSWDEALEAAGLDPAEIRALAPTRSWSRAQVLKELRAFAKAAKGTKSAEDTLTARTDKAGKVPSPRSLPNDLQCAARHHFATLEQAAAAAGVELEAISPRSVYKGEAVMAVVAAIRGLEGLKGRERRKRLDEIYHGNATARRIVIHHYGSLRQLALQEGIDPAVVATAVYRDEADVLHDLDCLELDWGTLDRHALICRHKRLYNVILETGWGSERLP